eukprot:5816480-Pleurochrysis_carterae.AAC.1
MGVRVEYVREIERGSAIVFAFPKTVGARATTQHPHSHGMECNAARSLARARVRGRRDALADGSRNLNAAQRL